MKCLCDVHFEFSPLDKFDGFSINGNPQYSIVQFSCDNNVWQSWDFDTLELANEFYGLLFNEYKSDKTRESKKVTSDKWGEVEFIKSFEVKEKTRYKTRFELYRNL